MKLFLQIILLLLIIGTIGICVKPPEMHKVVFVYDSAYTLVPENKTEVQKEEIPIPEKPSKPVQKTTEVKKTVTPVTQNTSKTQVKISTQKQTKKPDSNIVKQTVTKPNTQTVKTQQVQKTETPVRKEEKKSTVNNVKTEIQKETPKVLTEQEETIAWNIWRSNLQNKIMQDTKLPLLPNGIVFRFSFTVDKYGKITNLQTWSDSPNYTPYAIQYIAPVIRGYQGHTILNFPQGTARNSTNVKGGWKISANERYSTPQDYNDVEKVKKQY